MRRGRSAGGAARGGRLPYRVVRYGVSVPNIGDLDRLIELGVQAEVHGWDGFFLWDHMAFARDLPILVFDPWVALAAVATRTERIRLGTMMTPLPRRRPWKLARETVTLDHLSRGRLVFGVGLGYPRDADFELLGEDPDERVRAEKLDEGLDVLVGLWSGEPVELSGVHFRVHVTRFLPVPIQRPRIPVWVAGMWPNRAPFRRAGRWDGVFPIGVTGDGQPTLLSAETLAEVLRYVARHRRGSGPFDAVASGLANGDREVVRPFEEAGATWWFESDEGYAGWEDRVLARIRGGPPR